MLRREPIGLRRLARKAARRMLLPSLHAMRDQVDGALEVLDRPTSRAVASPRSPGSRILTHVPVSGKPEMDDLTMIKGIGAVTQGRLRLAGIESFADLAGRAPEELARLTRRSAKRIATERWVEQAREKASAGDEIPALRPTRRVRRQQTAGSITSQ